MMTAKIKYIVVSGDSGVGKFGAAPKLLKTTGALEVI